MVSLWVGVRISVWGFFGLWLVSVGWVSRWLIIVIRNVRVLLVLVWVWLVILLLGRVIGRVSVWIGV